MKVREIIRVIEQDGWQLDRQRGSHQIFRHESKPGTVTVAGKPYRVTTRNPGIDPAPSRPERSEAMSEYAVIYERGPTSWGAWVPDLPGCVAVGESREETEELIREAITLHIESMREHGESVPAPASTAGAVEVPA